MTSEHLFFKEKDILTGVQANEPLVNSMSNDPLVTGGANEFFRLSNLSNESPVFTFYVNGIRTGRENYEETLPLIDNLLSEAGIDSSVERITYNRTGFTQGVGDLIEAARQVLSNRLRLVRGLDTQDSRQLVQDIVEEIQSIDESLKRQAEENCQDSPRAKFLIVGHSQGNFFIEKVARTIEEESPEIANRTKLFAISSFTDFRETSIDVGYLLRNDDMTNRLSLSSRRRFPPRFAQLLVVPGEPNVPDLPGPRRGSGPFASHSIENYLNPSQAIRRNREAVQESFETAQEIIVDLLDFDSGFYEKDDDCGPDLQTEFFEVTCNGEKECTLEPGETANFQVRFINPDNDSNRLEIAGSNTRQIIPIPVPIPQELKGGGVFNFTLRNGSTCGSSFDGFLRATLYTDQGGFLGSGDVFNLDSVNINLLGNSDNPIPCSHTIELVGQSPIA